MKTLSLDTNRRSPTRILISFPSQRGFQIPTGTRSKVLDFIVKSIAPVSSRLSRRGTPLHALPRKLTLGDFPTFKTALCKLFHSLPQTAELGLARKRGNEVKRKWKRTGNESLENWKRTAPFFRTARFHFSGLPPVTAIPRAERHFQQHCGSRAAQGAMLRPAPAGLRVFAADSLNVIQEGAAEGLNPEIYRGQ